VIARGSPLDRGRPWRWVSICLLGAGVWCVVALHLLHPDLPPGRHRLSEYALGRHGWVMVAAFITLGGGLAALGLAIVAAGRSRRAHAIAGLLVIAGAGLGVSAAFSTDPERSGVGADAIHSAASAVATLAVIGAATCWTLFGPRRGRRVTTALATLGAVLGAVSPPLHRTALTGLSQRLLWACLIAWALTVGVQLAPGRRAHVSDPSASKRTVDA
jgi:hypothetical protein